MAIPVVIKAVEVASEVATSAKVIDLSTMVSDAQAIANEVWPKAKEIPSAIETEITPETIAEETWESTIAENLKRELDATLHKYFDDLKEKSDVRDTLDDAPFDITELRALSPEENALMREEFALKKNALKRQWEETNNRPWPKYDKDVYITNAEGDSVLIRKAGMDYDAHHIQPLSLGGKNEARNLTPLSADIHFDHKGIHKLGSPYDQISKMLGGTDL
ncbi:HNH endonuclease [Fournierella massiliensis]|nr:HNH endonuclease [Fournierella massiliensis]MCF2556004.1 HNH endonuclease [Fournierella massiliensis]